MDQNSRAQIRLILEDADARARKAVNTRLKAIYAKYSARRSLQSGATVKAVVTAVEEMASQFITCCVDQVATVAKDLEAFAMIHEAVEGFLKFLGRKVDDAAQMASGFDRDGSVIGKITEAARTLYGGSQTDLRRQLEIHRFSFTVPQTTPSPTPTHNEMPVPTFDKNRGGKPRADHWDQMWAAISVMLYTGDLNPRTQADIERAMKDWLAQNGFDVGDTAVRDRARYLWREFQKAE